MVKPAARKPSITEGRGAETRARILEAGLEMFSERGFDGTTTRDVAARADVNLGLIKYYFGSKEALWRAAVDRVFRELAHELGGAAEGTMATRDEIARVIRTYVRFAGRNPTFVRLMNDECKRKSQRMRWLVDRHGRALYETAVLLLGRARREGYVPNIPDVHLYYMFIGAVGLLFSQAPECKRFTGRDPTADERMIEAHAGAVVQLFLGGDSRRR